MKEWTAGDGLLLCWSLAEWCCWQPRVQQRYYSNSRINPDAGKSGTMNFVSCKPDARATPSAAIASQKLRFMEHPLNGAVKQHSMVQFRNRAVEPEVNAGDRRSLEMIQLLP